MTDPGGAPLVEAAPPAGLLKPFGSVAFFRLFLAQVASSTGDWLWFLAVAITGQRIGGSGFTISAALLARIVPAFFLAPLVGALVDRWDRKRVMIVCDIGRASMLLLLPLVQEPWQLVAISLGLEVFTFFWAPAKEASVPNLVPRRYLANANSFSVGAAYGSIIPAAAIFLALGFVADAIGDRSFLGVAITRNRWRTSSMPGPSCSPSSWFRRCHCRGVRSTTPPLRRTSPPGPWCVMLPTDGGSCSPSRSCAR